MVKIVSGNFLGEKLKILKTKEANTTAKAKQTDIGQNHEEQIDMVTTLEFRFCEI